jgi:hypothetical protein
VDIYSDRYLETPQSTVKGGELFRNMLTRSNRTALERVAKRSLFWHTNIPEGPKKAWDYRDYAGVAQG